MEWQPIETAPRDGTEILVYVPRIYAGHFVVWWGDLNAADSEWGTVPHDKFWCWMTQTNGKYDPVHIRGDPTHWMPLPPPPDVSPTR